jgi:hypothetical protein
MCTPEPIKALPGVHGECVCSHVSDHHKVTQCHAGVDSLTTAAQCCSNSHKSMATLELIKALPGVHGEGVCAHVSHHHLLSTLECKASRKTAHHNQPEKHTHTAVQVPHLEYMERVYAPTSATTTKSPTSALGMTRPTASRSPCRHHTQQPPVTRHS